MNTEVYALFPNEFYSKESKRDNDSKNRNRKSRLCNPHQTRDRENKEQIGFVIYLYSFIEHNYSFNLESSEKEHSDALVKVKKKNLTWQRLSSESLSESLDSEKSKDQLDSFFIADNQKNEDVFFVKVLHSNFSEEETLTKYLNSTIPKDQTHLSGRGQFVEVDGNEKHNEDEKTCRNFCSSFLCYFCAINNINASDELELVDGTSSLNSTNPFKRDLVRNGYIIAFCYDSQDEHSNFLPFFASELDNFCEELTPLFFDNRSEDLSHALLEKASLWYYTNIEFLSRSCQLLKDRLCHFLYATTTVPFSIRVIGEDNERKKDIEKLLKVCFINETAETSSYTLELLTNDTFEFNCDESNEFCMNFSEELIKIISTTCCALHLRAVLEDFKSKFSKEYDSFKNSLEKSINNHYALHYCYRKLSTCNFRNSLIKYLKYRAEKDQSREHFLEAVRCLLGYCASEGLLE